MKRSLINKERKWKQNEKSKESKGTWYKGKIVWSWIIWMQLLSEMKNKVNKEWRKKKENSQKTGTKEERKKSENRNEGKFHVAEKEE